MGHASLGHAAQRQAAPGIATYRHILAYRRFGRRPTSSCPTRSVSAARASPHFAKARGHCAASPPIATYWRIGSPNPAAHALITYMHMFTYMHSMTYMYVHMCMYFAKGSRKNSLQVHAHKELRPSQAKQGCGGGKKRPETPEFGVLTK